MRMILSRSVVAVAAALALAVAPIAATAAPLVAAAPAAVSDRLGPGETLASNRYLESQDGNIGLVMQSDGNLVVYRSDGRPIWDAGTAGHPGAVVTMQTDGNLVVVATNGVPLWNSGTYTHPGASLTVQNDGNVVVYDGSRAVFDTFQHPPATPYPYTYTLYSGERLAPNAEKGDGYHRLVMQSDGDLVLYDLDRALWSTGTYGNPGAYLVMQADGNLVVYSAGGRPLWNTRTAGQGISSLVVQRDANLVVYRQDGTATWWRLRDTSARL